jgi:hypothetical protein
MELKSVHPIPHEIKNCGFRLSILVPMKNVVYPIPVEVVHPSPDEVVHPSPDGVVYPRVAPL